MPVIVILDKGEQEFLEDDKPFIRQLMKVLAEGYYL